MVIDAELGYKNAFALAEAAQQAGLEIMISMEGTDRTDLVLEIHQSLCRRFNNVGITLQAYLYRTPDDLNTALQRPGKIRLVKGAYEAPSNLARSKGAELDAAYHQVMETLLGSNHSCSIATHDQSLLSYAHKFVQDQNLVSDKIEFEMLQGVTPERLKAMRVRIPHSRLPSLRARMAFMSV